MKNGFIAACALSLALIVAAVAPGSTSSESYKLQAKLTAKQEVPKPTGTRRGAGGVFRGTLRSERLTFRLTFRRLTGPATAAHIHMGKPGKAGDVLVALCGPCKSGKQSSVPVSHAAEEAIEDGKAYVNIHTAKNPNGEIRGQLRIKR